MDPGLTCLRAAVADVSSPGAPLGSSREVIGCSAT